MAKLAEARSGDQIGSLFPQFCATFFQKLFSSFSKLFSNFSATFQLFFKNWDTRKLPQKTENIVISHYVRIFGTICSPIFSPFFFSFFSLVFNFFSLFFDFFFIFSRKAVPALLIQKGPSVGVDESPGVACLAPHLAHFDAFGPKPPKAGQISENQGFFGKSATFLGKWAKMAILAPSGPMGGPRWGQVGRKQAKMDQSGAKKMIFDDKFFFPKFF